MYWTTIEHGHWHKDFHSYGSLPEGMYVVNIIFMWMLLCMHSCLVLYCIVLPCFCIALYCVGLDCIALSCIVLFCLALHCYVLYCIVLHCIGLYWIVLDCIGLYCISLFCGVLYCTVLYCAVLYCMVCFQYLCHLCQIIEGSSSTASETGAAQRPFCRTRTMPWVCGLAHGRTRKKSRCSTVISAWNDEDRCGLEDVGGCCGHVMTCDGDFGWIFAMGIGCFFYHGHLMGISIGFFG